ncbi:MAG: hypothetical protein PHN55_07370 [Dysgonamonadaceae bacterium]|nr:hypothetical protein [Dysgonamonadaceae bacterium]
MIILNAAGQTCNKFFTYLKYLGDSLETGEKIVILSPDVSLQHYPNLINSKQIKFPFYFKVISNVIGYQKNIKYLYFLFGNRYSIKFLNSFFKLIPRVRFINAPTGSNKSKNYNKHTTEIKNIFTPNQQIIQNVESVFNEIRITHQIICGVHLRYGDYKTFEGGKYYYSEDQYHSKMLEIKEIFPDQNVAFFISSNEKIDLSKFSECNCFTIPNSNAAKDLYGLSLTDYIIGPPSTFSGWASYYGNTPLYFIEDISEEIKKESFFQIFDIWT